MPGLCAAISGIVDPISPIDRSIAAGNGASWLMSSSFWLHFIAVVLFASGIFLTFRKTMFEMHGLGKFILLGPLFFAWPLAVFGMQHFVFLPEVREGVPAWMPGHLFWAVFVGIALVAASLSMITGVKAELAALMTGVMLFLFVSLIYVPNLIANPGELAVTQLMRDLSLSGGALALAGTLAAGRGNRFGWLAILGRTFFAVAIADFGVENLLHPDFAPVVPLPELMMPAWIPMHIVWAYLAGSIQVVCGVAMLLNWRTRLAGSIVGIAFLVLTIGIYLPREIMHPSIEISGELDYVAQTLAMSGAALLVAGAQKHKKAGLVLVGGGHGLDGDPDAELDRAG